MTKHSLTESFSATASTGDIRLIGLPLIGMDTRHGVPAEAQAALAAVAAVSEGNPQRAAWVQRYTAAAGQQAPGMTVTAKGFTM